jgi:two-component system LytT family response regulator
MASTAPLTALIVEDNALMAAVLHDLLQAHAPALSVAAIAATGAQALEFIAAGRPGVVFLDVELPDMTGFELLQQVEEIDFQTIFTTSHSRYAIRAFRFNALDYLVKPVQASELAEAIRRLLKSSNNSADVRQALANLAPQPAGEQKLVLSTQSGTLRLPLKQITHLEGERNYTHMYLSDGSRELSSKTLAHFEDLLSDKGFFRCHRSYLVNRDHVAAIQHAQVVLRSGLEIPVSRRKKTGADAWFWGAE